MAGEIRGTKQNGGNGRKAVTLLYYFPISPKVQDSQGNDIVAYDVNAGRFQDLTAQLSSSQRAAVQAGDAGYVVVSLEQSAGETDAEFAARLQTDYEGVIVAELQRRRDEAAETGQFDRSRFTLNKR